MCSEYIVTADSILTGSGLAPSLTLRIKDGYIDDIDYRRRYHRDIKVLDFTGYRVTPCFCDYHLHFFKGNSAKAEEIIGTLLSCGITKAYEGGDRNLYSLEIRRAMKKNFDIKTAGHALYKKGTYGKYLGWGVGNMQDAEDVIDRLSRHGADYIKVINSGIFLPLTGKISSGGFTLQELKNIVGYANAKGLDVACHANGEKEVGEAIEAGVSFLIHGLRVSNQSLTRMAEKEIAFIPTVYAFSRLGLGESEKSALIHVQAAVDGHLSAIKRADDKGVKVLPGSDSGPSLIPYGSSYHKELLLFQEAGIQDEKILSSAVAGSLERGAKADFLVLDGLTVKKVFINGRCMSC